MKSNIGLTSLALLILTGSASFGCKQGTTDGSGGSDGQVDSATSALVADANDASAAATQATNLDSIVFAAVNIATPDEAAAQASDNPAVAPPSCVTREQVSATVVRFTFNGCTGPFGLIEIAGSETATFSAGPGGALHVELASDGLTANGRAVDHAASADVTFDGAKRSVAWHGGWTHMTAAGRLVAEQSDLTLVVDTASSCITIDGTSQTTVDVRGVNLTFEGLELCAGSTGTCPSGSVSITGTRTARALTLDYDGSGDVHVTAGSIDFDVPLACGS